ncbi:MAG: hypothetical protein WEB00_12265 [Dehalococcoidia bacterium]
MSRVISLTLPDATAEALAEVAEARNTDPEALIVEALEELLSEHSDGQITRARDHDEADATITSDELKKWIDDELFETE